MWLRWICKYFFLPGQFFFDTWCGVQIFITSLCFNGFLITSTIKKAIPRPFCIDWKQLIGNMSATLTMGLQILPIQISWYTHFTSRKKWIHWNPDGRLKNHPGNSCRSKKEWWKVSSKNDKLDRLAQFNRTIHLLRAYQLSEL